MTVLLKDPASWSAEADRAAAALPGLPALRRDAAKRFASLGFPSGREEAWRFTDLTPLLTTPFRPATGTANPAPLAAVAKGPLKGRQVAFVDGRYAPAFSSLELPAGVRVTSLATLLNEDPKRLEPLLGRLASFDVDPFAALSAAMMSDGAVIHVSRGVDAGAPIHALFLSGFHADPYATFPRVLVVLEPGARATVVESHLGPAGGTYLSCGATEAELAEGSSLELVRVQRESREAFHVASTAARLSRGATLSHFSFSFGARLARHSVSSVLTGEGAEASLLGLFEVGGAQASDHRTTIDHAAPNTTSRELYKGILDGRGRGVFDGKIVVRKGAQKINAVQTNKNLLLSPEALVNTRPQLEILANDVKCKHGATVGQLDRDVLFYLRSRGIGEAEARRLLVHAFASEIVDALKAPGTRTQVGGCLGMMTLA
jgi:Fe-S cluster assembly protein SufD